LDDEGNDIKVDLIRDLLLTSGHRFSDLRDPWMKYLATQSVVDVKGSKFPELVDFFSPFAKIFYALETQKPSEAVKDFIDQPNLTTLIKYCATHLSVSLLCSLYFIYFFKVGRIRSALKDFFKDESLQRYFKLDIFRLATIWTDAIGDFLWLSGNMRNTRRGEIPNKVDLVLEKNGWAVELVSDENEVKETIESLEEGGKYFNKNRKDWRVIFVCLKERKDVYEHKNLVILDFSKMLKDKNLDYVEWIFRGQREEITLKGEKNPKTF